MSAFAFWQSVKQTRADPPGDCEQDSDIGAISNHTKAIETSPNDARAYLGRGTALHTASDYDSAISDFNKALELDPCCATAYASWGSVYYDKAHYDGGDKTLFHRAIADFAKAIEINPKSAHAYCNLGWTYEATGEEQKAVAYYRKALEIDPLTGSSERQPQAFGGN
jgi:tetratricopeptide (TPR) repeat protein